MMRFFAAPRVVCATLFFCVLGTAQEQELLWSTYLGGSGDDRIHRVTQAANGDWLVAGNTTSDTIAGISPTLIGVDDPTRLHQFGGFIARVSDDGQTLRWVRRFGRGVVFLSDIHENGGLLYITGVATAFAQEHLIEPFNGYDTNPPLAVTSEHTGAFTVHEAPDTYRSVLFLMTADGSDLLNSTWMGEPTPGREGHGIGDIIGDWYAADDMWRYVRQRENWAFNFMNPFTINRIETFPNGDLLFLMDGGLRWAGGQDTIYRFSPGDVSPAGLVWKTTFDAAGNNSTVDSPEHSSVMASDIAVTPEGDHVYVVGAANGWTGDEPYWNPFVFKFNADDGSQVWGREPKDEVTAFGAYNMDMLSVGNNRLISDSFGQALVVNSLGEPLLSMWSDGGASVLALRHPWTLSGSPANMDGDGFFGFRARTFAPVLGRMSPDGADGWRRAHRIKPNPNTPPADNATLFYGIAELPGQPTSAYAVGFTHGMPEINALHSGSGHGVIAKLEFDDAGTTRHYVERIAGIHEFLSIRASSTPGIFMVGGYGVEGAPLKNALQSEASGRFSGYLMQIADAPHVAAPEAIRPTLRTSIDTSGDRPRLRIHFFSPTAARYTLEASADLGATDPWTPVPGETHTASSPGEPVAFHLPLQSPARFYRIAVD